VSPIKEVYGRVMELIERRIFYRRAESNGLSKRSKGGRVAFETEKIFLDGEKVLPSDPGGWLSMVFVGR
jgi:hypothetical protein